MISPEPFLFATKLEPPRGRPEHLPRPLVLERLSGTGLPKLTVLTAPAGYGKTTLLADLARAFDGPVAWLSLDEEDGDPARFWLGVGSALVTSGSTAYEPWTDLAARGADPLATLIPRLVEEASALESPLALVLDDYHRLGRSDVHRQLARLVERLPPSLRIVVAARADPPLPLARLRAAGELAELRAQDMRFSVDEADAFLNDNLGLGLAREDVSALAERTEGWPAGLYLAALSLASRDDRRSFITAFAGTNRFIVDYLSEEVLVQLQPERRAFLLHSSILDTLTGPLVDAVLETDRSTAMLHELEQSNLFLVPLDDERRWYRFHRLFADLLRAELRQREPELVPRLHARACRWFEEHGRSDDAVAHGLKAGDGAATADLISANYWPYLMRGQVATVQRWIDGLPEREVMSDPKLCIVSAWINGFRGRPADVETWLVRAGSAQDPDDQPTDGNDAIASAIAIIRAGFTLGDVGAQVRAGRRAVAHEHEHAVWDWIARGCLGIALFYAGESTEAALNLEYAMAPLQSADLPQASVVSRAYLAVIMLEGRGDGDGARVLIQEAFALVEQNALEHETDTGLAHLARGKLLARQGELDDAASDLEHAIVLLRRGANVLEIVLGQLELAVVLGRRGDREAARAVVQDASAALGACRDPGVLAERLTAARQRLGLAETPELNSEQRAGLTRREIEVLAYLPGPLSQREIGAALCVSFNTVTSHLKSIYRKLGVSSRREAVERARELRIL